MCENCASVEHDTNGCKSEMAECCHCGGNHRSYSKICKEDKYQSEILQTVGRNKLLRRDAIEVIKGRYPNRKVMYSEMVAKQLRENKRNVVTGNEGLQRRGELQQRADEDVAMEEESIGAKRASSSNVSSGKTKRKAKAKSTDGRGMTEKVTLRKR